MGGTNDIFIIEFQVNLIFITMQIYKIINIFLNKIIIYYNKIHNKSSNVLNYDERNKINITLC